MVETVVCEVAAMEGGFGVGGSCVVRLRCISNFVILRFRHVRYEVCIFFGPESMLYD